LLGLGRFFSFSILNTVGRTPWKGDQPVAMPLPAHRTTQTQNKPHNLLIFFIRKVEVESNWVHSARWPPIGLLYLAWVIMRMENLVKWWLAGKPKYSEKTCPSVTMSIINSTWPERARTRHAAVTHTIIHALSGIRTYYPSVRGSEDSSCVWPRGHCDRPLVSICTVVTAYTWLCTTFTFVRLWSLRSFWTYSALSLYSRLLYEDIGSNWGGEEHVDIPRVLCIACRLYRHRFGGWFRLHLQVNRKVGETLNALPIPLNKATSWYWLCHITEQPKKWKNINLGLTEIIIEFEWMNHCHTKKNCSCK
jgi:hypothetical protein